MISVPIIYFVVTVLVTLLITGWAARAQASRVSLYVAGSRISAGQNGLALAGDALSAGALLGTVGLYLVAGVDTALYSIPGMAGYCLMLIFIVRPLRRLGRFTLGDVVCSRLPQRRMRAVLGACTVAISLLYLVAQLVGAGALISIVFGMSFDLSVVIVGVLMTIYVTFGGMLAATWVQIIKAMLLIAVVVLLAALAIGAGGGIGDLYHRAAQRAEANVLFGFGALDLGMFSAASLTVGVVLGWLGMPHVLIRFFTVPDEQTARKSLAISTTLIGLVMVLLFFVIGPASIAFLPDVPGFRDASGAVVGGPNMVALHLARFLGGDVLFGVMSAVAFATILAVVAGLAVAIASATSHDLVAAFRPRPLSEKAELGIFRLTALLASAMAVVLAMLFQHQNLTFLLIMGFTVAASTTFPLLVLAIYWPKLTLHGAMACGIVGLLASVGLIILGPACWVHVLGFAKPVFPSDYPALISTPLAFAAAWLVSMRTHATRAGAVQSLY